MINIGTNFGYQGNLFLDGRQGYAQTTTDLLNWSIPIPEGFEVCLNKVWYVYDSTINDPAIGHFRRRIDFDFPGSNLETRIDDLELLIQQSTNTLSFNSFNTTPSLDDPNDLNNLVTTLEVNSPAVNLYMSWTIKKRNTIISPTNAKVNNSSTGVSSNFLSYGPEVIGSYSDVGHRDYIVKVWNNNNSVETTYTINYKYKKFFGTSSSTNPTASEITGNSFGQAWADDWMLDTTIFDCSGGKYPYYVIPERNYSASTFTMLVNGLVNSDLVIQDVTINGINYKSIRTNNLQTGILRIRYGL